MNSGPQASDTSVNRFELLVQSITDYAIFMLEPDGTVASWNAGARRFKGYEADEIIGRHFSRFYTDEDRAAGVPDRALETARREGRFEAEGWRVRKDGGRFWASVVIDAIRDGDGRIVGFAKITRDLSDRRSATEALRRSEERFRLLVDSVTDYAIYMLDPAGTVASWNRGAQRFKGYRADEILGQHFSRFYTDEDRETGLPAHALAVAEREGRFESQGWRVRQDGTRFWADVVLQAVRDEAGTLIGFAKITRDLTERREAQRALEEAREVFFQWQKIEAIGNLTGGVAHDFNNLLAVVIGSLDLAKRRMAEGGDIGRFIDNARTAAERGATLTQRMLAFARRQELRMETVDPARLVQGMTDLLERTIGAGVQIETRVPPAIRPVHVDTGQLELAILNLAVNARDAMPTGGTITVSARDAPLGDRNPLDLQAGDYVCLAVSDTGEGMDADTLARAREPFFTTKGIGKGTGLGLSMVHGLAEQCRGRLWLASTPGEGTTAEIWLPVPAAEAEAGALAVRECGSRHAAMRPLSILVVDDDPLVLTNTAAMLEDLGHRVDTAGSAEEAIDRLRGAPVELIVTDYAMPRINGLQLGTIVRERWPGTRVLLATGYADLPAGTADLPARIGKPFNADQLAQGLRDAMDGGGGPDA